MEQDAVKTDNPAGRLYTILKKAKQFKGSGYRIWGNSFNILTNRDEREISDAIALQVIEHVIQLKKLINEIELSLKVIEGLNLSLYLTPFDRIRGAIKLRELTTPNYETYLREVTEGDLTVLAFCADVLSRYCREPVVEESQLEEILDSVGALYTDVFNSSLEDELKVFILDELEMLRRAIHEFRVRGFGRLKEAMPSVVGSYVITREWISKSEANDEDKSLLDSFSNILGRYGAVVSFAANTTKLLEAASIHLPRLLPGG
jgi:hypothetical protein